MPELKPYREYLGQAFYDYHGVFIHEVGNQNHGIAEKEIEKAVKALEGRWAFALCKQMTQRKVGERETWNNSVVFVDGKMRQLKVGEKVPDKDIQRMVWIPKETVESLASSRSMSIHVLECPSIRIGRDNVVQLRRHTFADMIEFEQFFNSIPQAPRLFVYIPKDEKAPEGEGLCIYLATEVN